MGRATKAVFLLVLLAMFNPHVRAQEKAKSDEPPASEMRSGEVTPVKVAITFAEFEGDKKVKSLPYNLVVVADGRPPNSKLRMGSRVPVYTGKENGMQYLD